MFQKTSFLNNTLSRKSETFQPKLTINTTGDQYEQEADAMADKVMRMSLNVNMHESKPMTGLIGKSVQRKCSKCEEDEKKKPIMRKTQAGSGGMQVSPSFASSLNASKGGGSPLSQGTKSFMENAFSTDFSKVKIHTDSQAIEMSKGISAKAFTYGNDIYFNSGEYDNTESSRKLLAHELTHVVQQNNGEQQISRAWYHIGTAPNRTRVNIDYGQVVYYLIHEWQRGVEDTFARYTGQSAASITARVAALSDSQKRWLMFAIDLLSDNELSGFNKTEAVIRLIEYASSASYLPLAIDFAQHNFENEVLRVTGWFEKALTSSLITPSSTMLDDLHLIYNPNSSGASAATSTCPGVRTASEQLDEPVLRTDLPPLVRTYLHGQAATIAGRTTRQDNISEVRGIADIVQQEALQFFAPYIGRGSSRNYLSQWIYSAHLISSTSTAPPSDMQFAFIKNRAWREADSSGLFTRVHFDSRCTVDETVFENILQQLLLEAPVQADLSAILSWQTFTQHDNTSAEVTINLQSLGSRNECESRWTTVNTLCHELMHVYVHQSFYDLHHDRQIIREGFSEVLGDQLYDYIRRKANRDAAYRVGFEIGLPVGACSGVSIPASSLAYPPAGDNAELIRSMVGDNRFRAAYFLGQTNLVGLQPKLFVGSTNDTLEQEADAMADKIMHIFSAESINHSKPIMPKSKAGNMDMLVSSSFASSLSASKGGGSSLPKGTKNFMENAFSTDFSKVRIHTDSQAAEMSSGINAKAFTYGNDIYFNSGEFASNTEQGKKLLAHELTHVIQQENNITAKKIQRQTSVSATPISPALTLRGANPSSCLVSLCSQLENPTASCLGNPHGCAQSWITDVFACLNSNAGASNASHASEIIANTQQELTNYISYMNSMQPITSFADKRRYIEWLSKLCLSKKRELFIEFHHNIIFDNVPTVTTSSQLIPWGYYTSDWDEIEQALAAIPDEHLWGRSSTLPIVHFRRESQHASGSSIGGETDPTAGTITIYNAGVGPTPMGRSVSTGVSRTNQTIRHEVGHLIEASLPTQEFFHNIIGWHSFPVSFLITNPPANETHRGFQTELCTELMFVDSAGQCDHARMISFIDGVPLNGSLTSNNRVYTKTNNLFMSWPIGSVPTGPEFSYARTSPSDYFAEVYSFSVSNPEFIHNSLPANQIEWLKQNLFHTQLIYDELILPFLNLASAGNAALLNRYQILLQSAKRKFTRQQLEPISQQLQLLLMQIPSETVGTALA
jgi:hypothetical protein